MTVKFTAIAKTPGLCAMAGCKMEGRKIYEGDGLRLLACTEGHANAVLRKLEHPPKGMSVAEYRRLLPDALRLFNARNPRTVAPVQEAYYDIPI